MSVEEAIAEFSTIVYEVYAKDLEPLDRTTRLKKCVESILVRRGLPLDLRMEGETQDGTCIA